jgi:hypothetical protein
MEWWQFLFTVLFGLPLAALAGVIVGGSIASLRQRRLRPAVERHRFVPTRAYGDHPSEAFLLRSVSVGDTRSARAEIDGLRPPDLS